jgi:hypothetical protein
MSLDDTLRWADRFPMENPWPEEYSGPELDLDPNWRWLDLWDQENPRPYSKDFGKKYNDAFSAWYAEEVKMRDRVWVAACLPQFHVFDWSDEDVALARKIVARHVCVVCGRSDDPGCVLGC